MTKYDTEQTELEAKIAKLTEQLEETKVSTINPKRFIEIIKKYQNPQELTRELIEDLVDKIVVYESVGKKPNREQQIDIYFNFIGQFEPEYTKEELAELKEQAEKKESEKLAQKKKRQSERSKAFQEKVKAERWEQNGGHKFAERICERCGKPFLPNGNRQRYCSKECTYEAQQEAKQQKRFDEKGNHTFRQKECAICGKLFWPSNGQEVLCSQECKEQNRRQKQLAYYHKKQAEKKENEQWNDSSQTKEQVSTTSLSGTTIIPASRLPKAPLSASTAE